MKNAIAPGRTVSGGPAGSWPKQRAPHPAAAAVLAHADGVEQQLPARAGGQAQQVAQQLALHAAVALAHPVQHRRIGQVLGGAPGGERGLGAAPAARGSDSLRAGRRPLARLAAPGALR